MRIFFMIIALFCAKTLFSQQSEVLFNDDFNSNKNNWKVSHTTLRLSEVVDGKLVDYFGKEGVQRVNLTHADFDDSGDYVIRFSLANLNNESGYKYPIYSKYHGKLTKRWVTTPQWGFIWGFKDWDNYNAIVLQKAPHSVGIGEFGYKAYSMVDGIEICENGWQEDPTAFLKGNTAYYDFVIRKKNDGFLVLLDLGSEEKHLAHMKCNTEWLGDYVGPFIGAGAQISLDYIKIEKPQKPGYVNNFNLSMKQINSLCNSISDTIKGHNPESYLSVKANLNGTRTLMFSANDISELEGEEREYGLKMHKKIFKLIFQTVNDALDTPVKGEDLISALQSKNITNLEFDTKGHSHSYTWDEIL